MASKRFQAIPVYSILATWLSLWVEIAVRKQLSVAAVAKLKKQGRYGVGDGVYLQISKWKTRAWVFRYERFGKAHYMGLGPCHLISLAEAQSQGARRPAHVAQWE